MVKNITKQKGNKQLGSIHVSLVTFTLIKASPPAQINQNPIKNCMKVGL